jgi:hypothetical protein
VGVVETVFGERDCWDVNWVRMGPYGRHSKPPGFVKPVNRRIIGFHTLNRTSRMRNGRTVQLGNDREVCCF